MNYLIVGLGNVGEQYKNTRHNIGFMVLDRAVQDLNLSFSNQKFASVAILTIKKKQICLAKPTTFMNKSGQSVKYWAQRLSVELKNILIVVDDLFLPLGKLRIRTKGSAAGHNGLIDIEASLLSNEYPRLRLGIGNNFEKGKQSEYVLSHFNVSELNALQNCVKLASDAVKDFYTSGIDFVMNNYNSRF